MRHTYPGIVFEDEPATETDEDIAARFGLPELPEAVDDPDDCEDEELAQLAIARQHEEKIYLAGYVTVTDAMEYCSRDDTRDVDAGWMVIWYRR